ncbi:MAG TPA: caspase family protein, partial [Beijerinckiaceae bacterium]|nr:caspase family protein [Beijerinckiaceae bacterium]
MMAHTKAAAFGAALALTLALPSLALSQTPAAPPAVLDQSAQVPAAPAQTGRLALVVGDSSYQAGALPTSVNDAGLINDALQQAGFQTTGVANVGYDDLRKDFRDFLHNAAAAGPDGVAFVYLAGYGLQYDGENYFVPIGAHISRNTDIPEEAIRISDFVRALSAIPLKARIIVLDAAHASPYGQGLAGGLGLMQPDDGTLIAFNAAPGTIGPSEPGPYGAYAQALNEMMHECLPVNDMFERTRLRVSQITSGALVPWDASKITSPFKFFEQAPNCAAQPPVASLDNAPIKGASPDQAYAAALARDTISGYGQFLAAHPSGPLAKRVHALLAARREALTWNRALTKNTPSAYWTYEKRYPKGPHVADARRRLHHFRAAPRPPRRFRPVPLDVAPPSSDEYSIVDQPDVVFDSDYSEPSVTDDYLPPLDTEYYDLPAPESSDFDSLPIVTLDSGRRFRRNRTPVIIFNFGGGRNRGLSNQQNGGVSNQTPNFNPSAPSSGSLTPTPAPLPQGPTVTPATGGNQAQTAPKETPAQLWHRLQRENLARERLQMQRQATAPKTPNAVPILSPTARPSARTPSGGLGGGSAPVIGRPAATSARPIPASGLPSSTSAKPATAPLKSAPINSTVKNEPSKPGRLPGKPNGGAQKPFMTFQSRPTGANASNAAKLPAGAPKGATILKPNGGAQTRLGAAPPPHPTPNRSLAPLHPAPA